MTEPSPFAHVLHAEVVRALADSRSFERGRDYQREGRVSSPLRSGSRIEARVRGSLEYMVALWVKGEGLAYSCTCPHAAEGAFCKHCVAVALAWLDANGLRRDPLEELRSVERFLSARDKDWLVRFVLEHAAGDPRLLAELSARAQKLGD